MTLLNATNLGEGSNKQQIYGNLLAGSENVPQKKFLQLMSPPEKTILRGNSL